MRDRRLTTLLGIDYPIIQGGMAWVSTAELAAAVSNAGGLGIIAAGNMPVDLLRLQIEKIKQLTTKPYGVNVMLLSPHADEVMSLVLEERVPVISTGAGNPGKYVDRIKSIGSKVMPVVPSVALAKRMEKAGVDAVIAEGLESGGHISDITTMALVPQVVDAVSVPVVAAGGIADGRGMAAAFALGAEGIQIGTRFISATECTVHPNYKKAVIDAGDRDTVVTGRPTGHPVRILRNQLAREFHKLESKGALPEEFEKLGIGRLKMAAIDGDVQRGSVMAGQIAGLVRKQQPAADIIKDIITQAEEICRNL